MLSTASDMLFNARHHGAFKKKTHEIMFGIGLPVNAKNLDCNNFLEEVVHYRSAEGTRLLSMAAVCETFIPKRMSHKELAIM